MLKKFHLFVLIFISLLAVCVSFGSGQNKAEAVSLWADDSVSSVSASLFADRKARRIGDILTIIISETSSASRSNSAENSKSGNQNLSAGTGIFHFLASATASQSDNFQADGSLRNSNNVRGRITVQVVDVKPNGNLVVSGTQSIKQNRDEHKIVLTGVVRCDDISDDNTILSSQVADANITFDGKGPLNRKQRQGILTQILNFLF